MIGRQKASGDGGLDLLAVQRDDELLDLLAAREEVPGDDELMLLLARWRDELDEGLAELLGALPQAVGPAAAAAPARDVVPAEPPSETSHRHRLTATGMAAALVIGGTLSVSGVAAAVTGDPFAPYRAVGNALSLGEDDLPPNAAEVAHLNRRLRGARAALAHGDTEAVARLVDQLSAQLATADLTDKQRATFEHRLTALRAALAREASAGAESGRSDDRAAAATTPPASHGAVKPKRERPDGAGGAGTPAGGQDHADEQENSNATGDRPDGNARNDGNARQDGADDDGARPATDPGANAPTDPANRDGSGDDSQGGGQSGGGQDGNGQPPAPGTAGGAGGSGQAADRTAGTNGQDAVSNAMSNAGTHGPRR